ncbi:MAG: hypothetical protein ACI9WU_000979 [Myxococcota bacterium]|jgi:hypothetical protein
MRRFLYVAPLVICLLWLGCEPNKTTTQTHGEFVPPADLPLTCLPDFDGQISAAELTPTYDIPANFLVSASAMTVDLQGQVGDSGRRIWDWSTVQPTDRMAGLKAQAIQGRWFAPSFPQADFVTPLDAGGTLLGVYHHDVDGLWLHGTASAEQGTNQTLLIYEAPVDLLRFPLVPDTTWAVTGQVRDGTLNGLSPWSQDDTYTVEVDAAGELRLPQITFPHVLRVRTHLHVVPLAVGQTAQTRQVSFMFECFGEVARATSAVYIDDGADPGANFTQAAEVRRLGSL